METDRLLPRSEESEQLVLGTLMSEKNALAEVRGILTEDMFYFERHKQIYRAILRVADRGDFPDMVTVLQELKKDEPDFPPYDFSVIAGKFTYHVYQHAAIVFDKYQRRKFFEIGCYLNQNAFSEETDIVDVAEEVKRMLEQSFGADTGQVHTVRDAIESVYAGINRNLSGSTALTGSPTGFRQLDAQSGGLQTSDLIVIAADTSSGKSSLAIKLSMTAGCPVAFYSLEMKSEQIAARMMAMESGVPANEIMFSRLDSSRMAAIDKGVSKIADMPIYFDDRSTSNIESILSSIRLLHTKYGIKGAVVDYLQILNVNMKGENKEQQMGTVARRLKNLAKELDIWIIALSQLNRDRDNPVPSLARLRDSGQIAEAADVVMLIYRPELYGKSYPEPFRHVSTKGTAMIDVAKGRNIGLLKFIAGFDKPTTKFYELESLPFPEPDKDEPF